MTTLHDAAMAARRFHDAVLVYLDSDPPPNDYIAASPVVGRYTELNAALRKVGKEWL